ncbi:DUF2889 domain-containing protein [Amycolatopsis thermoflava]|uniref:DUF2889 domain-containing protein n=1 Tax=Amycolatopsis thermoflava TaxID=84480 RepID=UPI0037F144A2
MLERLPSPRSGTVRRTVSLLTVPEPTWVDGLRIVATGRDLAVGDDGARRVLGTRDLTVALDGQSRITELAGALPSAVVEGLAGRSVARGLRAHLAGLDRSLLDPSSLEAALLDDLPTVGLVSGYGAMMEHPELFAGRRRRSPMIGVCAGWAPDATADRRTRSGEPLLRSAPRAPAMSALTGAPEDFHAEPAPRPRTMRRRRVLDVTATGAGWEVFEYFRDSYFDPGGQEGSLHEYTVRARVAADGATIEDIAVTPEALPFPECPLAAPYARELAGTSVREVGATIRSRLSGTRGCTHLNDVLRFLRHVPALTSRE